MYLALKEKREPKKSISKPQIIYGTTSKIIDDDIYEGKRQFNKNCASCHALGKISCPDVLRLGMKYYDQNTFLNFVKNEIRERKTIYCDCDCKALPNLNNEKIEYIYKYITYSLN